MRKDSERFSWKIDAEMWYRASVTLLTGGLLTNKFFMEVEKS